MFLNHYEPGKEIPTWCYVVAPIWNLTVEEGVDGKRPANLW